jgi:RND family efflux transporter MFP subunit
MNTDARWILPAGVLLLTSACTRATSANISNIQRDFPVAKQAVAVARVSREPLSREIVLTGEFRPYQAIDLHAKVAGYLKEISVDVGDRVKAGQLLAIIEIPEMNDELVRSEAESRRSHSELERAKSDLERSLSNQALVELSYKRLLSVGKTEPGLIAQQEIDEAAARKRTADAQVAADRAALVSAEQQIGISRAIEQRSKTMVEYARIVAPFSGVITKRFADPGAMIQAGTASQSQAMPVVRLAQIDRLRTVIPVPESIVPLLRVGAGVNVRINSLGKTYPGRIARFNKDVATATRTMEAEIDFANPDGQVVPGMYADVVLTLEKRQDAVTVPVQALISSGDKKAVMVVTPQGLIEERLVQLGIETAARVEVRSGVNPDELVVVGNRTELKVGQVVLPKVGGV